MDEKKTIELKVEELEERIAPIVDPFLVTFGVVLPGEGGGGQAVGAGAVGGPGNAPDGVSPVNAPVPLNNPGSGSPSP